MTCSHLQTVQQIRIFSITNKKINFYLTKSQFGLEHWSDAGLRTCGAEYWVKPMTDVIYNTMLQICPWTSAPTVFPIIPVLGANSMRVAARRVEVVEMRHRIDRELEEEYLCIRISLDSTDPTQEHCYELEPPCNSRHYEVYAQYNTYSHTDDEDIWDLYEPQKCDDAVIAGLSAERWDRHIGRNTILRPGNVLKVHDGVFAAVKSDHIRTKIFFVSYKTHRVLECVSVSSCSPRCIVFGKGYVGGCSSPSDDRGLLLHRFFKFFFLRDHYNTLVQH